MVQRFFLMIIGAVLVAALAACGGASQSTTTTPPTTASTTTASSTATVQGDYVASLPDGHTGVALSTDGQQLIAYACDGDSSHTPTFAQWFRGSVANNSVDLNSTTGGDRLQATLTPQNAASTLTLKDGTTFDFTAEPLTSADNSAGSGLYRSQVTLSGVPYLAGWIVDKPEPADPKLRIGTIVNQQTQELLAAPDLTDADIAAKQVVDPNLGTVPLTRCQQGTCS